MTTIEDDESIKLVTRALYIEPLAYSINLNGIPSSGQEYIHMQRMQYSSKNITSSVCKKEKLFSSKKLTLQRQRLYDWKRTVASYFRSLTKELISDKQKLQKRFPRKTLPPIRNELSCCTFCLGSELSTKIFSYKIDNENFSEAHLPLLSIVLYLNQCDVVTLLDYLYKWHKIIGMDYTLYMWVFSLLTCLEKPISDDCEDVLLKLYEDFIAECKKCNESDEYQFQLFCSILEDYFAVHTFKVGPSLEKFLVKSF